MPFSFVLFVKEEDAMATVRNMDGIEIRGNIISIKVAEYKRGRDRIKAHVEPSFPRSFDQNRSLNSKRMEGPRSFKDVVIGNNPYVEYNKGKLEE